MLITFLKRFNLQTNIIQENDSDLGRFILSSRNQRTILTLTPVRVGIGIVFGKCQWWNLSQNRLELNWNCDEWNSES